MANALEMKDICIGFSGVQVLKNVSLTVREGTVHGLVGENGAGKSTLIKKYFPVHIGAIPERSGFLTSSLIRRRSRRRR